jgi:hypothetical protein
MSDANGTDRYDPPRIEARSEIAGVLLTLGSGNIDAPPI